jgi:signal recognition particle receptor subunit beta
MESILELDSSSNHNLPPESEEDNIEYKRLLTYEMIENTRIDSLVTQMKWRIWEGCGNATYYLGINDNGSIYGLDLKESRETINVFKTIVKNADVNISSFNTIKTDNKLYYKICIKAKCVIQPEIRILIIGPENSGKTTLVSALIHKQLDNGKGYLRNLLLSHKHELYSGKSNSITIKTLKCQNTNTNIILIDTPSNVIENKNYLEKLALISNCGIVLEGPGDQTNDYVEFFKNNNLPFSIIKTKSGNSNCNSNNNINLLKELPIDFIQNYTKVKRDFSNDFSNENKIIVLTKIYSGDCIYLLICVQISGIIKLGDNIVFSSGLSGQVESIQYLGCTLTSLNSNVTFTCFIKTDQNIKKLKGEIFYSI